MSRTIFTFNWGMRSDRYLDDDVVVCRGIAGINSAGNSKLARIYLRSAWRNSSRSKYDRSASILIRSGGLRASEKFPVETPTTRGWPRFRSGLRSGGHSPAPYIRVYSRIFRKLFFFVIGEIRLTDNIDVRPGLGYRVGIIRFLQTCELQGRMLASFYPRTFQGSDDLRQRFVEMKRDNKRSFARYAIPVLCMNDYLLRSEIVCYLSRKRWKRYSSNI